MNPLRNPAPWILPALCCGWMSAAGPEPNSKMPDDKGVQQWTDFNGGLTEAYFIRKKLDEKFIVVVTKQGERKELEIARLSKASQEQIKKLSPIIDVFKPIRGKPFMMGSPGDEPGREPIEIVHKVRLSSFDMKATEVTWTEWNAVRSFAKTYNYHDMSSGGNGTAGLDADLNPVVGITWWDALKWCNLKSELEKRDPVYRTADGEVFRIAKTDKIQAKWQFNGYRLPTEAEWEFACRGGRTSQSAFHTGQIDKKLDRDDLNMSQAGWYAFNSEGGPREVAHPKKRANSLGLYDMHGNAAEWCWDVSAVLGAGEANNPRGPDNGEFRVVRGGSWKDPARKCRAAARVGHIPEDTPDSEIGFRPVRPYSPNPSSR